MPGPTPCHSLKLPFRFDGKLLAADLDTCMSERWKLHFNTKDYSGDWTSVALYSSSGTTDDIRTHGDSFAPTALLGVCPHFKTVIDSFQCEKEAVRLLNLAPGSVIHEHRDRGLAYEHGSFRVHVPVQTAPDVDFIVGGKRMDMAEGECWYANFDLPHSVKNNSVASRIHLVIDCKRNAWSDQLFAEAGYDFEAERKALAPDAATIAAMIAQLEAMNTDTSRKLIADLKAQLHGT